MVDEEEWKHLEIEVKESGGRTCDNTDMRRTEHNVVYFLYKINNGYICHFLSPFLVIIERPLYPNAVLPAIYSISSFDVCTFICSCRHRRWWKHLPFHYRLFLHWQPHRRANYAQNRVRLTMYLAREHFDVRLSSSSSSERTKKETP